MKKYYVLYNPYSDNGKGKENAEKIAEILSGDELTFTDVTSLGSYEKFFAEKEADAAVVLCGGDGTLNRFVNDVGGTTIPGELYYFASGSGNDFLRDIGKEKNELIDLKKYIAKLPTVFVNGKTFKFLNNVGFGIDGYCCEVGDELRKTSDKPINYAGIAVKGLLFKYKPTNAKVTVDGKTYEFKKVWLAPTMNGRFYGGGMMPTPDQDRLDEEHKLSVLVMHGGKLGTLMAFPSIFKGEHVKKKKKVSIFTGKEIHVEFDRPVAIQIDGETVLGMTEYSAYSSDTAEKMKAVTETA